MRILVITAMWPSPGMPQFGVFVERQVEVLRRAGATVDVVAEGRGDGPRWRSRARYVALAARSLVAVVRHRPDVIVGHMLVPPGLVAVLAGVVARRPVVLVAHGQDVTNAETRRLTRAVTGRVVDRATALVCVSADLARRLDAVIDIRAPLHVLHVGVDRACFAPETQAAALAALGEQAPGRPLVVQVGSLIERKNAPRLAEAVLALRDRHPGATLWLAGDGPLAPALRGKPHVRVFGSTAPERVRHLLCAADAAALVSLDEAYGLGAIEGVACGVPTVVTRVAGVLADLPATAAVPCDPLDAASITAALEVALALPRNDPAGQAAAAANDVDRQAARLLDVLRGLVGSGR